MKITFLQDDFPPQSFGGAGISVSELALKMRDMGHEISVITTCRTKAEAGREEREGITVFRILSNYHPRWRAFVSLNNRPVVKEVDRILSLLKPDVVHANNVHEHLSYRTLQVAKKHALLVVTLRDTMAFTYGKLATKNYTEHVDPRVTWFDNFKQAGKQWNPFRNLFIKKYLRAADYRVAISGALKEALEKNGIPDIKVIHNGIDAKNWQVKDEVVEEFKAKHNLFGKQIIFFNGRLSLQKGAGSVLEAMKDVVVMMPNAILLVAGTGELENRSWIRYTGWLDRGEIKKAYAASHIVLMPSVYLDAFGRVNIEAMATHKPVIGTCFGGTPEIVQDGVTGYIVNPLHPEEIAAKLIELLRDPEKATRFGEAGYERALSAFNLDAVAEQYLALYKTK